MPPPGSEQEQTEDIFTVAARRVLLRAGTAPTPDEALVEITKALRGVFAYACRKYAEPLDPEKFMDPCPPPESMNYRLVKATLDILRGGLNRGEREAVMAGATYFPPRA